MDGAMIDPATCPPAPVSVPHYMAANVLPDGRICVWDEVEQIIVDGARKGRAARVRQAALQLDKARADRINQMMRELR
jgi:hypothetical protein